MRISDWSSDVCSSDLGQALAAKYGDTYKAAPEADWLALFRKEATEVMMAMVRDDLAALNTHHALFTAEKALHDSGAAQGAFDRLKPRGLLDRKRAGEGKSGAKRVDPGGSRHIKK